jgi:hypothetical protein
MTVSERTRTSRVSGIVIVLRSDADSTERLVAEANLSFALNTSLFSLVPAPQKGQAQPSAQVLSPDQRTPEQLRAQLDRISWAVGKFILPQIYDILGL